MLLINPVILYVLGQVVALNTDVSDIIYANLQSKRKINRPLNHNALIL